MRLILALLITGLGSGGIGYRLGFTEGVLRQTYLARRERPAWKFEDYYADPATRPAGDPGLLTRPSPDGAR